MKNSIQILRDLVRIKSTNHMGVSNDKSLTEVERELGNYLESFFQDIGIAVKRQEVFPGRDNIIAFIPGKNQSRNVLFDAHMDTVPVDQMTIDPFDPIVSDGKLFGRGACDTKGSMATFLAGIHRILDENRIPETNIIFIATVDEEHLYSGVWKLVKEWKLPKIELAIVGEPTSLNVITSHKGLLQWQIKSTGQASHGAYPDAGVNAIYKTSKLIRAIEEYSEHLKLSPPHDILGRSTINLGYIKGGSSINTVPDICLLDVEYRLLPGETPDEVLKSIHSFVDSRVGDEFEFLEPFLIDLPLETDQSNPSVINFRNSCLEFYSKSIIDGIAIGTNASKYQSLSIPTVVFGPGSIKQAHSNDEWISIQELELAEEIIYKFLATL